MGLGGGDMTGTLAPERKANPGPISEKGKAVLHAILECQQGQRRGKAPGKWGQGPLVYALLEHWMWLKGKALEKGVAQVSPLSLPPFGCTQYNEIWLTGKH